MKMLEGDHKDPQADIHESGGGAGGAGSRQVAGLNVCLSEIC